MTEKYISSLSNQELQIIAKQSGILICKYNIKTKVMERFYNSSEQRFGVPQRQENMPNSAIESNYISDDTKDAYRQFFNEMDNGNPTGILDVKLKNAKGGYSWYRARYSLIYAEDGSCKHSLITFFDNSKTRERELAVEKWHTSLSSTLATSMLYAEINLTQNKIIDIKSNLEDTDKIINIKSLEEFVEIGISGELEKNDCIEYYIFFERQRLIGLFQSNVHEDHFDFSIKNETNEKNWIRATVGMIKYPYSEDIIAIITFTNINTQKKVLENLSHKASHDVLTGILNRDGVSKEISEALEGNYLEKPSALFIIDLDDFKQVNDRLGHQTGDFVLQQVASALNLSMKDFGIAGRLGGDEFIAFYLGEISRNLFDQKAIELLNAMKMNIGNNSSIKISISIGIAFAESKITFENLYRVADIALYTAKKAGKSRYHIINADTNEEQAYISTASGSSLISLNDLIDSSTMGTLIKTKTPYEALVENIPCGVLYIELDDNMKFTYCNDWMYTFTGYTRAESKEIHGENLFSLVHPDDMVILYKEVQRVKDGLNSASVSYRLKHKDGYYKRISLSASVTERREDMLIMYGITTDIDNLTKIRENVNANNKRIESIINSIPGGVCIFEIGDSVNVTYYNNWFFEYSGLTKEETNLNRNNEKFDTLWPEDRPIIAEILKNVRNGEERVNVRYRIIHKDGTPRSIILSGVVIERTENSIVLYAICFDNNEEVAI